MLSRKKAVDLKRVPGEVRAENSTEEECRSTVEELGTRRQDPVW